MNKEADNIGKIFKETLQNHRIESNADLWARLDTQLASQPHVVPPKASVLKSLSLAKVAASASLIVSVALAYNYIYLPLTTKEIKPLPENTQIMEAVNTNDTISSDTTVQLLEKPLLFNQIVQKEKPEKSLSNIVSENNYQANSNLNSQNNSSFVANNLNNQQTESVKENTQQVYKVDTTTHNNKTAESFQNNQQEYKPEEVTPKVSDDLELQIPNIFTPNGDGINDNFLIRGLDKYPSNQLYITNRFGKTVYERINYQNDWNASNIPDGVYYYMLKIKSNGKDYLKSGVITIAR